MPADRVSITELRDEYVICRALGHAWDENPTAEPDSEWAPFSDGFIALRCTRCLAERLDYIGHDLAIAYRRYVYPPRYKSIPGEGTRPNLRGEMFRRSLLVHSWTRQNGQRR
jgi:hypothetical protein